MSKIHHNPSTLSNDDWAESNMIDSMLTDIMLAGERQSSPKNTANVNIGLPNSVWLLVPFLIGSKRPVWRQKNSLTGHI